MSLSASGFLLMMSIIMTMPKLIRVLAVLSVAIVGPVAAVTIGAANILKGNQDTKSTSPLKIGWAEAQKEF